jgi:hypothetical protein
MERYMFLSQRASRPSQPPGESGLHQAGHGLQERGSHQGWVRSRSLYLKAQEHARVLGVVGAVTAGGLLLSRGRRR